MNETEENKAPEQEKSDTAATKEAAAEVAAPATSEETSSEEAGTAGNKEPAADASASESISASDDGPETAAVEEKEVAADDKSTAKAPTRTKQPTPADTLNISEDKNWYVVQAFSGYEASVKRSLLERIERAGLGKDFGEILVPTEEVVEIRGGQKRRSERKFFPGYVLVQMDLNDETWHLVKNVPRVLGFIGGTADRPAPITDKEADAILQRVQDGVDKPRPKVLFDVGEVVRVTDGPFNDFNGVVEEVNFEKNKLLVAVQIFGRSTPVELEFSQVEKA